MALEPPSINFKEALGNLRDITAPHSHAFDFAVNEGFEGLEIFPIQFDLIQNKDEPKRVLKIWYERVTLGQPLVDGNKPLYPRECRERGLDYSANLQADFCFKLDDSPIVSQRISLGDAPVMVMSRNCRLFGLTSK
jgi:DNA-directed RNA polymerase beta subunit